MKITFVNDEEREPESVGFGKPGRARAPLRIQKEPEPGMGKRHKPTPEGDALNPTRYLDWEKNGQCIDF